MKKIYSSAHGIKAVSLKGKEDALSQYLGSAKQVYTGTSSLEVYYDELWYYLYIKRGRYKKSISHIRKTSLKIHKTQMAERLAQFKEGAVDACLFDVLLSEGNGRS